MEAKDLMIGDLVVCCNSTEICRVISVTDEGAELCGRFEEVPFGLLEPIPITPDILEKYGFTWEWGWKGTKNYYYKSEDGNVTMGTQWNYEKCEFSDNIRMGNKVTELHVHGKIVYVHQLQHALRFCGIKKDIEL